MMGEREKPGDSAGSQVMFNSPVAQYTHTPASQHPVSPAGSVSSSIAPVSRSPFPDGSNSQCVDNLDKSQSGMPGGMNTFRYRAEQYPVHEIGQLTEFQYETHRAYDSRQNCSSVHMSDYCITKNNRSFTDFPSHNADKGQFYRGSAHQSNHFDRSQLNTSSQYSCNSTQINRTYCQASCPDNTGMDNAGDGGHFIASPRSSPGNVSAAPGPEHNCLPEDCSVRGDSTAAADAGHPERYHSHVSNSVPRYIPLNAGSNYIYCNCPSVSSFSSSPANTHSSFGSSVDHVTDYSWVRAPAPAHSHLRNILVHSSGVSEGGNKSTPLYEKQDATSLAHNQVDATQRWNHNSITDHCERTDEYSLRDQSSTLNEENARKTVIKSEATSVRNREVTGHADNEPESHFQVQDKTHFESKVPQTETDWMTGENKGILVPAVSDKAVSPLPVPSSSTCKAGEGADNCTSQEQLQQGKVLESQNSNTCTCSPSSEENASLNKNSRLTPSLEQRHTPPGNTSGSLPFVVTPSIYSDSSDEGEGTELEEKPVIQKSFTGSHFKNSSEEAVKSEASENSSPVEQLEWETAEVDSKAGIIESTETAIHAGQDNQTGTGSDLKQWIKEEPQQYDSSTSEYEPPSPCPEPVRNCSQSERKMTLRERRFTVTFNEDSDNSDGGETASVLRPHIKSERPKEKIKKNTKPKQPKTKTIKRSGSGLTKDSSGKKRDNRTCPLCNKTFTRTDSLTCHMRVHTGDRPFRCDQCDASYKVSSHLRDHVRSKHSNSRPYECGKCGKTFSYPTARRRHEKVCGKDLSERVEFQCASCEKGFVTAKGFKKHQRNCGVANSGEVIMKDEDLPFKCSKCVKAFSNFPSLDRHQRFFCGKTPQKGHYACGECGKTFYKRNRYITHTRRHTGEKPFKCPHCEVCFYDKSTLRRHIDRHEGNKKFKCSLCNAAFYMKRCLALHVMRIHCGMKPFKCNECDSDFSCGYKLSRHIRRVHRKERRFKCMLCDKGFFESGNWMKHMRQHALHPDKPVRGRTVKQHTCKLCNKSFFMKDMRAHIASEHPGAKLSEAVSKDLVTCNICSKDFSCQDSLRVHQLRHTGVKPFQCDKCDMAFLLKSALVLHQRKHTDYRPYCCPECGKTFRWQASVTQHMTTYHAPKPQNSEEDTKKLICNECGKQFKREICLKVHLKRHRAVMPCICTDCGKGFVDMCRLKIHMSKHDGPKPFMCETCGAGYFYQYLLDDHIKRRHTVDPNEPWLCEECGKLLCRKDSFHKHMALHAKYQDGKIPKAGRRKGIKYPSKHPVSSKPDCPAGDGLKRKRGRPKGWRKNPDAISLKTKLNVPLLVSKPAENQDLLDLTVTNETRPNYLSMIQEQILVSKPFENQDLLDLTVTNETRPNYLSMIQEQILVSKPAENRDLLDLTVTNETQPNYLSMIQEQSHPHHFNTYIHHSIPWPKPEEH